MVEMDQRANSAELMRKFVLSSSLCRPLDKNVSLRTYSNLSVWTIRSLALTSVLIMGNALRNLAFVTRDLVVKIVL